jgi:uncharacterized MAPEG superfamily protein
MSIALWCVISAAFLPYLTVVFAKRVGGGYDNRHPRAWAANLTGLRQRAYAAHQNHFEFFPFFAAAVLIAEMKSGRIADPLAVAVIGARLAYTGAYLTDRHMLRTLLWALGIFGTAAIFILGARGM